MVRAAFLEGLLHDAEGLQSYARWMDAYITLLPKAGNLAEPKNWRPISLLNSDYKILMAVLAGRMQCHRGRAVRVPKGQVDIQPDHGPEEPHEQA